MKNNNAKTLKVLRSLTHISEIAKKKIKETQDAVEKIAIDSTELAKETLRVGSYDPEFTQKHEQFLANYIHLDKGANKGEFIITAGGAMANNEILYELYFAEYGAGRLRENSNIFSSYVEKGQIMQNGFWFYPLVGSSARYRHSRDKIVQTRWGYTDRSIPLRYMLTSRLFAKEQLKLLTPKISKSIRTSIKRGTLD